MSRVKFAVLSTLLMSGVAHAQSSVELYGIIDTGVMYVSNVGGHSNWLADPDTAAPDLFGLRGTEDLGGGLKAIFKLEGMFSLNNGESVNGLFGHEAYVGLRDERWGTLTAGNQIDFMFYSLVVDHWGPAFPFVNSMSLRQGSFSGLNIPGPPGNNSFDFDRTLGAPIENSVKYMSPTIAGLSVGAQYSFGGQAGSFGQNSAQSFGINYHIGTVALNGAYTYVKYPELNNGNDGIRNMGLAASWVVGPAELAAMYTNTQNTENGARVSVYETDVTWTFSQFMHANLAYQFMKGNDVLKGQKANQETLSLTYSLSKRTSIYSGLAFQQASGGPAWISLVPGAASGGRQTAVDLGILHVF
ncbi:putative porin [Paraburkholderia sp. GAS448]|uniref:porin n=1 Tax=Paraburkholderia sp. GAS448 TaxID=3035136 RepID=UPI003D242E36